MTEERWQVAFTIYEAAALLAEPERQAYIHAAAPDQEIADKTAAPAHGCTEGLKTGG